MWEFLKQLTGSWVHLTREEQKALALLLGLLFLGVLGRWLYFRRWA